MKKKLIDFIISDKFVLVLLFIISFVSLIHFFTLGQITLYADTMSRLDISRKVIDNINPGFAQLGNVWLPLPQLLMIPFIWDNFLWHTGLAGAIMSMGMYILSGYYIYKAAKLITKSHLASYFSLSIFAFNINIVYLQTTAMSESLFLATVAASIYYFLAWIQTNNKMYLIPAGLAMSAMTFTRYEGLSLLLASIPMVFIISLIKKRNYSHAEGQTLLFTILAITGFGAWTLYLAAIFGDPLYWIHYYATPQANGGLHTAVKTTHIFYSQQKTFLAAVWQYLTSTVWMDGLIPVCMALLSIPILIYRSIRDRNLHFIVLLMPLSLYVFMVLTLQRNTPIVQPDLSLTNLLNPNISHMTGFNIRYGILLLPWIAIISSYLFNFKYKIVSVIFFSFFAIQIYSYFSPQYSIIYQIPATTYGKPYTNIVTWMKKNYTQGKILISASSHEDQMFLMGFAYKTYIHEGTGKYWKESLDDPTRYATWIIIDYGHPDDQLARNLKNQHKQDLLARDYKIVFSDSSEQVKIYKVKGKPYFNIP